MCPQESVYCENKCGARMMRRLLSQHGMAECPKRTQPCKYCGKEFVFDTIQVSFSPRDSRQYHRTCCLSCSRLSEGFHAALHGVPVLWQLDVTESCLVFYVEAPASVHIWPEAEQPVSLTPPPRFGAKMSKPNLVFPQSFNLTSFHLYKQQLESTFWGILPPNMTLSDFTVV